MQKRHRRMKRILILWYCGSCRESVTLQQENKITTQMNIKTFLTVSALTLTLAGSIALTASCEDGEKTEQLTAVEASGRFPSKLTMDVGGGKLFHEVLDNGMITVVSESAETVQLQLGAVSVDVNTPQAPINGADVNATTVSGVKVKKEADGSYTLSGTPKFNVKMRLGMGKAPRQSAPFTDYEAHDATVSGTLKDGVLHLTLSFRPGTMPFPILLTYDGKRA